MSSSRSVTRSTCQACSGPTTRHAPNAPLSWNDGAAGGLGQPAREPLRVARDREIDVVGVAPEQLVAHGAADEPHALAGQHLARELQRHGHKGVRPL